MTPRASPTPLDPERLERLALRYVERYATSRAKLASYLWRKIRERGWSGDEPADPAALAERMASRGYVDDRGFAEMRAMAMTRRGLGPRRIAGAWRAAGIAEEDADAVRPLIEEGAEESAIAFARRKRLGPFARTAPDRAGQAKALATMLRAGHDYDLARRVLGRMPDDEDHVPD